MSDRIIIIHSIVFTITIIVFTIYYRIQTRRIKRKMEKYNDKQRILETNILSSTRGRMIKNIEKLQRNTKNQEEEK